MKSRKICSLMKVIEITLSPVFRVDDPLVVPFTKESPFLIPFKKTFSMMRRVGVLTDIFKNYQPHEVKQCSSGMVINIMICSRIN